jgi:hypothetical protein
MTGRIDDDTVAQTTCAAVVVFRVRSTLEARALPRIRRLPAVGTASVRLCLVRLSVFRLSVLRRPERHHAAQGAEQQAGDQEENVQSAKHFPILWHRRAGVNFERTPGHCAAASEHCLADAQTLAFRFQTITI